jgi:hypothetical protein
VSRTTRERVGARVAAAIALALLGAAAGLVVGLATPTHLEIAGTDATIQLQLGRDYDELEFTGLLTGKRPADRRLFGEPVGVRIRLDLDTSTFLGPDGSFDPRVLPAYIQTYSNPRQLGRDVQHAIAVHVLHWVLAGAAAGVFLVALRRGYVAWRHRQDARLLHAERMRGAALTYRAPERRLARRAAVVAVAVIALGAVPGSGRHVEPATVIVPTPLLDQTPLAGAQVGGPLLPAFDAAEAYVRKYFADTNTYYEQVRTALTEQLASGPPILPSGADVAQVGFVTDRHCNTGMDRVIVALLEHLDAKVLVSAGDDAFSGTFGFESACTAGLAAASRHAAITDVFVGGNHDSPMTLADEKEQGIKVLDGDPVAVDGLTFAGSPDPRTSRYGEGLRPAEPEVRAELIAAQGERVGASACKQGGPVVVVLHDPVAARTALENGCGNAVLALSGHVHAQRGPDAVALADGATGYTFTGASTGGAPSDKAILRSFASSLTVGPLRHQATIDVISLDRATGELLGVTECHISPNGTITFDQQLLPS